MKTLVINGSPRENGDSMTMIKELTKYLIGEVIFIDVYNSNISHCSDCRYCWTNKGCSIEDGMDRVYQLLNEVDNVIIGSPIYFYELSGGMFNFASRLQLAFTSEYFRKDEEFKLKFKNGVLVLSAGGDVKDLEGRALRTANIIFKHMNAKSIGTIMSMNTNEIPASQDFQALNSAKEIALRLNKLYKLNNL